MSMTEAMTTPESFAVPPPPANTVAIFREGRYGIYERPWHDKVDFLDIDKPEDRDRWVFLNMAVFNDGTIPAPESNWRSVVDYWLTDLRDSARLYQRKLERLRPVDAGKIKEVQKGVKQTERKIKAMMAVSASARAMEDSAAVPDRYLKHISMSRGDEPDTDAQDYMASFLLHKDSDKYIRVITDPLVGHYYQKVLEAAHLKTFTPDPSLGIADTEPEWHKVIEKRDKATGKVISVKVVPWDDPDGKARCSRVIIASLEEMEKDDKIKDIREKGKDSPNDPNNRLIYYLCKDAQKGGFEAFIEEVLLKEDADFISQNFGEDGLPETIRWSAARLACDAFFVDKFTRWTFQLTSVDRTGSIRSESEIYDGDSLRLAPRQDWGGDPFTNILQPSFLPRQIKRVYTEEAAVILDLIDKAFRPDDIFFGAEGMEEGLPDKILHPTAVEHFKNIVRYNQALGFFFGSSRAAMVPKFRMSDLRDSLEQTGEKLAQIYGTLGENRGKDTGKQIMGAIMARLILAKAVAARASMVNPPFFKEVFGTLTDPRSSQPLAELREYLFGPGLDWRGGGFVADLISRRTKYIIKGNRFHAEEDLERAFKELATPEEGLGKRMVRVGAAATTSFAPRK